MFIGLTAAGGYHLQANGVFNADGKWIDCNRPNKVGQDVTASAILP